MKLRSLSRTFAVLVPGLAALVLHPGCETTEIFQGNPDEATPSSGDLRATAPLAAESFDDVWDRTRATLEVMGFQIDDERTHYERRELVTRWMTHLSPFRFQGFRRRAHVAIEPADDRWIVKAAVLFQRNADIDNPASPAQVQWETQGIDSSRTALLLYRISSAFDPEAGGSLAVPPDEKGAK